MSIHEFHTKIHDETGMMFETFYELTRLNRAALASVKFADWDPVRRAG